MRTNPIAEIALRLVAFAAGLIGVVAGIAWTYVGANFLRCADLACTTTGAWQGVMLLAVLAITAFVAAALALNFALRGHLESIHADQ